MSERWPATTSALRAHRAHLAFYYTVATALAVIQITVLGGGGSFYYGCGMLPLYLVSWVVPAIVAAAAAKEIASGRWTQISISGLRTADLWFARVIAPVLPWMLMALALSLTLFGIAHDPNRDRPDIQIIEFRLYLTHVTPWAVLVGIQACAVTYASLAVICAFRCRTFRDSLVSAYMTIVASAYFGVPLTWLLGDYVRWAHLPALTYALYREPWCLAAPPWMVGATMYGFGGGLDDWIVAATAAVFFAAGVVFAGFSYLVLARARQSDWLEGTERLATH